MKKLDLDLLFDIHPDANDRTRNRAREHWLRAVYAGVEQQYQAGRISLDQAQDAQCALVNELISECSNEQPVQFSLARQHLEHDLGHRTVCGDRDRWRWFPSLQLRANYCVWTWLDDWVREPTWGYGGSQPKPTYTSNLSWNLGVGLRVDPSAKVLG